MVYKDYYLAEVVTLPMTKFVSRHCELAKQSRCTSGFWIASQARNDGNCCIVRRLAMMLL